MSSSIPPSTPGKPWQPPAPEDLAPELPAYEILGLLGRGGMGAVYHARQKSLNREVAIKILPPRIEDNDMHYGERFRAEAQSMARLNHPGIIGVYDCGETPGGLLYFVMEYVQGTDVHQMIVSSGRLPPQHAHAIVAHVCDALAYAHAHGLIHRDIKPANVMVDMQGRVKVADFGLAKAVDAQTGFTQSNMAVGTQDFVAPEALIAGMPVDGHADLYAVGVMLYQMLTGHIPRGAWQPASVLVPGTDRRFDEIIVKAMQYGREARHSSALELRQHLDTLLMPAVPAPDLQRYSSAQMPQASRPGVATARPAAASAPPGAERAEATPGLQGSPNQKSEFVNHKSKSPLFIGLGIAAAIAVGTFVMFSGKKPAPTPKPQTLASSATPPVKVIEPPKPEPKPAIVEKAPEAPKPEPKPVVVSPPSTAPAPTASAKAVSPMPGGPGISATALQDAAAPKPVPSAPVSTSPSLPVSSPPSPPPLPPELAALDAHFITLQKDRVTTPYEADLGKLHTSYLSGIDKAIAAEKAAGHLDGILALEAEKKLVASTGSRSQGPGGLRLPTEATIPDTDDEKTPETLKKLLTIWRSEHTKLLTTRAASLQALLDPLDKRLATMETDFTKADRLASVI